MAKHDYGFPITRDMLRFAEATAQSVLDFVEAGYEVPELRHIIKGTLDIIEKEDV